MPTRPSSPPQLELNSEWKLEAKLAPKLALPFPLKNTIDTKRARLILGVNKATIEGMLKDKVILAYRVMPGVTSPWRIEYDDIVDYCNRLRVHYNIPRRQARAKGYRMRDADILPFPLDETIRVKHAADALGISPNGVLQLIDSGSLVAYQIIIGKTGIPWRIHEPSLERYIRSLHATATKIPTHTATSPSRLP